jgi:hypothetical protein
VIVVIGFSTSPPDMASTFRAGDSGNAPGAELAARRAEEARRRGLPCGHCVSAVGRDYIVRVVVDMDDQRLDAFEGWIIHPECWDEVAPVVAAGGRPSGPSFQGATGAPGDPESPVEFPEHPEPPADASGGPGREEARRGD